MRYRGAFATSVLGLVALAILSGCTTPALVSSWKAPDATPFQLKGEKVAAIVMTTDMTTRRAGEDALARHLSLHGVEGVPMYTLLSDPVPNEAKARAAAEQANIVGVVILRPVSIDKELSSRPTYSGPMYGGFWGGAYGLGWGSGSEIRTSTIVTVETLVYGLRENKLLWGGQSRTTNPRNLDRLIEDTAEQVSGELVRLGLIAKS